MELARPVRHIVANGCSETAHGVGGCPPTADSHGGCSYIDCGDGTRQEPGSWAGFVARDLNVQSLVNLAAESHGNYYIMQTMIDFLSRHRYPANETLVIFNVSEPLRLDFPCSRDHPDCCDYVSYGEDLLPYTWLKRPSRTHDLMSKHVGLEQAAAISRASLLSLFAFLEQQGFRYLFITMHDYRDDPYIGDVIAANPNRVDLEPGGGIVEFARDQDLLRDSIHPTVEGHRYIADQVSREIARRWN